jgi:hypothetical protein
MVGLVLHAVCKALRKTLPHNAQRQYLSPLGRHVPRSQAQRGDTIYWATNGNCRSAIKHVAIVKDARIMLNAPNRNARVREQAIWTQSGSLRICPDAVRLVLLPRRFSSSYRDQTLQLCYAFPFYVSPPVHLLTRKPADNFPTRTLPPMHQILVNETHSNTRPSTRIRRRQ